MRIQPQVTGRITAVLILASILTGCATSQQVGNSYRALGNRYSLLASPGQDGPNSSSVPADVLFNRKSPSSLYSRSELHFEHPKVDAFVLDYETRSRGFFARALDRAAKYVPRMAAILQEEGVPPELAYLPLIESGYNNRAVSHAGAGGPWQFMPATGRRYGLRIDRYVDERRDPDKATRAAAQYLKDLYDMFGDWHLSLAAYNTGEYRVARTMDREGTDSYWDLMENRDLHPETCDYVPRFLAALTIAESPEQHGFESPDSEPIHYDMVAVDRAVSLRQIAALVGAPEAEVRDLNPALVQGVTPPAGYDVRVPPGTKTQFEVAYSNMRREALDAQALPLLATAETSPAGKSYRVRKGDSVATIAARLGVSTSALLQANGLKNAKHFRMDRVLRVPGGAAPAKTAVARAGKGKGAPAKVVSIATAPTAYKVKKGDTVGSIARRLGVTEKALLQANGLKNAKALKSGATLRVPAKKSGARPVRVATKR